MKLKAGIYFRLFFYNDQRIYVFLMQIINILRYGWKN